MLLKEMLKSTQKMIFVKKDSNYESAVKYYITLILLYQQMYAQNLYEKRKNKDDL